jgi:hypothetical protein
MGLRLGGGVGEYIGYKDDAALGVRYVVDFAFFITVLIILLNVVFGIIIDTFSELREEKKERRHNTCDTCFICSFSKHEFDGLGHNAFQNHIRSEHNMWAYMKFICFLWEQDQDDDDGLELYVRYCLKKNDLSWFPRLSSLKLHQHGSKDDSAQGKSALDERVREIVAAELEVAMSKLKQSFTSDVLQGVSELLAEAGQSKANENESAEEHQDDMITTAALQSQFSGPPRVLALN